jgi:hypothetical protein
MELPSVLIERIVASIESQMPVGFTLEISTRGRMLTFRVSPELAQSVPGPHLGLSQIGVRNRTASHPSPSPGPRGQSSTV